jgi:hypothetical protein
MSDAVAASTAKIDVVATIVFIAIVVRGNEA